jgi:hypothetical protein
MAELVQNALDRAIQQTGDVRLVSKGAKAPGLFPGRGTNKLKTEAIASCFAQGFFEKSREVEEGKGRSAKKSEFVRITPVGIKALFENLPIERGAELLQRVSPAHLESAEKAFRQCATAKMQALESRVSALLAEESNLHTTLQGIVNSRISFLAETRRSLEQAIEDARHAVEGKLAPVQPVGGQRESTSKGAITEEDLDFQRDQSEQLVFAWQDARDQTKSALENVMYNLGLEAVGERGQVARFDGREHETDEVVEQGQPVTILHPGWRLSNSRGVYLISKARVTKEGENQCPPNPA